MDPNAVMPALHRPLHQLARRAALALCVAAGIAALAAAWPDAAHRAGTSWGWAIPALFVSAAVASVAGFAFSAIALATAGWFFDDPVPMVATFLACSISMQAWSVWVLRAHVEPRALWPFVAGGLLGTPIGTAALLNLDANPLTAMLGAMLIALSVVATLRRPGRTVRGSPRADAVAGLLGGVTGGLAAFPGAVTVPWIGLRGWPKERQRGTVQPYILAMQLASLGCLAAMGGAQAGGSALSAVPLAPVLAAAVASLAGARVGLGVFARIGDRVFARWVLGCLAASGVVLLCRGLGG
ncbi:MAG: TSUP family transporter [Burkholderiales bacterium]